MKSTEEKIIESENSITVPEIAKVLRNHRSIQKTFAWGVGDIIKLADRLNLPINDTLAKDVLFSVDEGVHNATIIESALYSHLGNKYDNIDVSWEKDVYTLSGWKEGDVKSSEIQDYDTKEDVCAALSALWDCNSAMKFSYLGESVPYPIPDWLIKIEEDILKQEEFEGAWLGMS